MFEATKDRETRTLGRPIDLAPDPMVPPYPLLNVCKFCHSACPSCRESRYQGLLRGLALAGGLASLAADDLTAVSNTFTLVWFDRAELLHLGGDRPNQLLVDSSHDQARREPFIRRGWREGFDTRKLYASRRLVFQRVRIAKLKSDFVPLLQGSVTHAGDV